MRDGVDENMMDSSAVQNHQMDSSMQELHREELLARGKDVKDKMVGQLGMSLTNSSTAESMPEPLNVLPCETAIEPGLDTKVGTELLLELESALADKSNQLSETEIKLKAAVEDVAMLKRELDTNRKLLDESQVLVDQPHLFFGVLLFPPTCPISPSALLSHPLFNFKTFL